MQFDILPNINYKINNNYYELKNLLVSNNVVSDIYEDRFFDTMYIQDQTPEELSYELYGDTQYHWILLYVNKIVNPFEDWVIPVNNLNDYFFYKYGSDLDIMTTPKFFIDLKTKQELVGIEHDNAYTYWLDNKEYPSGIDGITYYDYEININEQKRYIRYVPQRFLLTFIERYESNIKGE